ncbi:ionotropic receptor 8a isoform X2 [Leptinotarsa decemlineata]|uniref:ionotropic receptor 8a isoform X2 n=1 Tax=Leptinotarsa decemlineata TaxID=7539 RepID=UPI003D30951F
MFLIPGILMTLFWVNSYGNANLGVVILRNADQHDFLDYYWDISKSLKSIIKFEENVINVNEEINKEDICRNISGGAVLIVDLTWTGNELARALSRDKGLFYVRIDLSISPFLDILRKYMEMRNATDVTIILGDSTYTDQTLYHLMNNGELLLSITETLDASAIKKLKKFRPIPSTFAIIANSKDMQKLLKVALRENLVTLPERWNLLFLDFQYKLFDASLITNRPMNLLTLDTELCCQLLNLNSDCDCPNNFNVLKELLRISMNLLVVTLKKFMKEDFPFNNDIQSDFNTTKYDEDNFKRFEMILDNVVGKLKTIRLDDFTLRLQTRGKIEIATSTSTKVIAQYENEAIRLPEHETMTPIKAFYRIGITHALPWSYKMKHPDTGEWVWTGYCVDFAEKLAKKMNFEYEFIEPTKGTFGKKENGIWDGVVGDLASGQTDLAITAIIMTADREEVVDFVAPYFEQSGITIVMRKPVKKTSLFKFMTVLKLEVWLSIVAALIVTGFMVWFLDKYSPYSARNNKKAYLYPCRMWKELTLNASTDDSRYRVWDYPIREQYGHILLAINDSNPVENAEEGFRKVNEHLDADYAFIHDSSEIKYRISKNCNLTEVGEVFAEKPYAVAVQQGSHLQDAISKTMIYLSFWRMYFQISDNGCGFNWVELQHISNSVGQFLNMCFPNEDILRVGPQNWSARSPDLTCLDFFLWGYLKNEVFDTPSTILKNMKERVRDAFRRVTPKILLHAKQYSTERVDLPIQQDDSHFEHLL